MRRANRLKKIVGRFFRECCGPTATEYAVLLVLIIFGALTAISLLGSFVSSSVQSTSDALPSGQSSQGSSGGGSGSGSGKSKPPKSKTPPVRRQGRADEFHGPQYALVRPAGPDGSAVQS